jgi:putative oxygen-independent coproporphyrinogen III oxidase
VADDRPFGVYVHVPFCRERCDYCAFVTFVDRDHLMEAYASACAAEIARAADEEGLPPATSVYFGGGTPSRLPVDTLLSVLDAIPRVRDAEVTVECNPEDAHPERLAAYRGGGVTRVSLGVQSTVGHVLAGLGRRHGGREGLDAAVAVGEAGFASWNADLIFGGAGERDEDWERSIGDLLGLRSPPPHLSAYALTVEPATPLSRRREGHPDEDVQATRYEQTDRWLAAAGYRWEEISNWAKPGHGCRHNRLYWDQGDYRGIGAAAHSHRAGRRWRNVSAPERYVERMAAAASPTAAVEVLDPAEAALEALWLALRTPAGVPASSLPADDDLAGLLERDGPTARLTLRGRLLANAVATRLSVGVGSAAPTGTIPRHA